jgi:sRNA-binding protein
MAKPEDFFDQNIVEAKATVNVTPKAKKPTLAEKAAAAAAAAKANEPEEPPVPETRTPPPDLPYTPDDEVEDIPDTL